MKMELLSTCFMVLLITGLGNAADLDQNTPTTLTICHLHGERYAFKCSVAGVSSIETGFTMELTKSGDQANIEAVQGTSDVSAATYIIRVAEIDPANLEYTCRIKRDGASTKSLISTPVEKDAAEVKACVKSTTSSLEFCKQYGSKIAVTCKLSPTGAEWPLAILDVSSGHTVVLNKGGTPQTAERSIYAKNAVTQVYNTLVAGPDYACLVHVKGEASERSTPASDVAYAPATEEYCIEGKTSTLSVTKKAENEFLFQCDVSGSPQLDVSQGHDLKLKKGTDVLSKQQNVQDVVVKTSISRTLTTFDESNRNAYECEIHVKNDATKKSSKSAGVFEVQPCNAEPAKDSASGIFTSLPLIAGCVAAALLRLTQ